MKLTAIGEMDLVYVGPMSFIDYGVGGQYYAHMEGDWRGDRISGRLRLTNIAQKRADNVNTPALRGVLETHDGATLYVEMNGLSQIHGGGRAFVNSLTFRTAHPTYQWATTMLCVVEGELYGPPRPNELRARCRVFACEETITTDLEGGIFSVRATAFAVPVSPGQEGGVHELARELDVRRDEFDRLRRQQGITREAAFLQRTPVGAQVVIYREAEDARADGGSGDDFSKWLADRMRTIAGFDPEAEPSKVELLIRRRSARRGDLYAVAMPIVPGKTARLHEFALELGGIHASEFDESLRRLRYGLTLFVQHTPDADLAISVIEGDDPDRALGRLAASEHPFDRWHVQQIVDQTGLDVAAPPPPPNESLWTWHSSRVDVQSR